MARIQSILMLGDSLTEYWQWRDLHEGAAIINHGIAGDTTMGVWGRAKQAARLEPSVISLQVGINDLGMGIPPADICSGHGRIWNDLETLAPRSRLVVCSLMPIREDDFFGSPVFSNANIRKINATLGRMAGEKNLPFLDLYAACAGEDGSLPAALTVDGVHLTPAAYGIWTRCLGELLRRMDAADAHAEAQSR